MTFNNEMTIWTSFLYGLVVATGAGIGHAYGLWGTEPIVPGFILGVVVFFIIAVYKQFKGHSFKLSHNRVRLR